MKRIGIIYGSTTGTTEGVARLIGEKLGVSSGDIHDVSQLSQEMVADYDVLLLGSSTWGDGELQDDWYDGVQVLAAMNLSGKCVGFFGCGDSDSYSDTFCDAMGLIYNEIKSTGCDFCGRFPTEGYSFDGSAALVDGEFVGVAIDEINEDNLTEERISAWIETLKQGCIS